VTVDLKERRECLARLAALGLLAGCGHAAPERPAWSPSPVAPEPSLAQLPSLTAGPFRFVRPVGTRLLFEDGSPAVLRGYCFGNDVYTDRRLPVTHHDERDYQRLRAMGMNLVRFYLHWQTFESDARPGDYLDDGWAWLDLNIEWARRHGIYLILNFHAPPGGYQSTGKGDALWAVRANQLRLAALWHAIAQRYANEPVIAGYDLVNEPVVPRHRSQWQVLAQELARAIRSVDARHPVIVERVNAVAGDWSNDSQMNFVTIDDPSVIYTFHCYDPFEYTHQFASWTHLRNREGGRYPQRGRDKAFLQARLDGYIAWAQRNNAALFLGEFGVIRACYENDRGGLAWMADMVDLLGDAGIAWTCHAWHEDAFGLYRGGGGRLPDPANANQPLIALLTHKLNA
jgi:hypothetical protein